MKIKKIKPMFTTIVTTMDLYKENVKSDELIDVTQEKTGVMEFQKVLAIGDMVRAVKVGDLVKINPDKYAVKKQVKKNVSQEIEGYAPEIVGYNFRVEIIDDKECMLLQENDVDYIVEDYEDDTPSEEALILE